MPRIIHTTPGGGGGGTDDQTAAEVPVDTTNFDNNLGTADSDVQTALETLDDLTAGDVSGPASSTDERIARWDGTTGKLLKDSNVYLEDSGDCSFPASAQVYAGIFNAANYVTCNYIDVQTGNVTIVNGNIVLAKAGATVDGVDLTAHVANVNAHHNQLHTVASHSDTTATGAELNELTDGSETTLHDHPNFDATTDGFVPNPGSSSGKYLKDDATWDTPAGGGGGAPTDAEYVVISSDSTLTDERTLTAGSGITITDGGAGSTVTVQITDMTTNRIRGRASAGSGAVENLTPAAVRIMLIEDYTTASIVTGEVDVDASSASKFDLELTDDCTINKPSNLTAGQSIEYRIHQDSTGGRTVTWSADFETGEIPSVSVADGALEYTYVLCKYNDNTGSMDIVAFMRGYT